MLFLYSVLVELFQKLSEELFLSNHHLKLLVEHVFLGDLYSKRFHVVEDAAALVLTMIFDHRLELE